MQEFFINKGSVNPPLRMELIDDGRYDFKKSYIFNNAIQDAVVTFSMRDKTSGKLVISKSKVSIVSSSDSDCSEKYILEYNWKERDVKKEGTFQGWFEIDFNGNIKEEGVDYPKGNLIVPIKDELIIYIK